MKKFLLVAAMAGYGFTSFAGAYQLNLQGIRQAAMGGAGTAWAWDASTIFYNPGGLSSLKGIQAYGSLLWLRSTTAYGNSNGSARTLDRTFNPLNFYVGGSLRENGRVALGLGLYTPFAQTTTWDNNWSGRYIARSVEMTSYFIQPTISYKLTRHLSVGGGFIYATGTYQMERALPVQNFNTGLDVGMKLKGDANGAGFNLGLHYNLSNAVQLGLTYRSQVVMNVGGGSVKIDAPATLRDSLPNTRFETAVILPQVVSFGLGVRPTKALTLQLDLSLTGWETLDTQRINFRDHSTYLTDIRSPRRLRNTVSTRVGANVRLSKVVSVMGGFALEPTPVNKRYLSPELPDNDAFKFTLGASVKPLKGVTVLASLQMLASLKRNTSFEYTNFAGSYKTESIAPGIGIYYNF